MQKSNAGYELGRSASREFRLAAVRIFPAGPRLLFLRYAEARFADAEIELKPRPGSRLTPGPDAFKGRGVLFLTPEARFSFLRDLPEGANLGRALNNAMTEIETNNPELAEPLPKNYQDVPNQVECC